MEFNDPKKAHQGRAVFIVSTMPHNTWAENTGTSMATPIVAGALARGLSAGMLPLEALQRLIDTSDQDGRWVPKIIAPGPINIVNFLQ